MSYYIEVMKTAAFPVLAILVGATVLHGAVNQSCRAGSQESDILRIHGRLEVYNGGYPNLRLWRIGTHHLYGIYSDPADLKCDQGGSCGGDGDSKLPSNLEHLNLLELSVYGDFELRLLVPYRRGHMQAACIVDAHRLVLRRAD